MTPDRNRLLIISPVRNEASHVETLVRSMASQTRPPDLWLVVDDGSNDGTLERLHELSEQVPFMTVLQTPQGHTRDSGDRHAVAAAPRAFNWALATVDVARVHATSASSTATSSSRTITSSGSCTNSTAIRDWASAAASWSSQSDRPGSASRRPVITYAAR